MRDIKFRAWDKVNKKYIYTGLDYSSIILFELDYNKASPDDYVPMGYTTKQELERFDVEQYTCLNDKNGVEIYEGDVVIYDFANGGKDPVVGIVKYKTECASYGVVPLAYMDSIILFADLDLNAPLEVVGNIHDKENKE